MHRLPTRLGRAARLESFFFDEHLTWRDEEIFVFAYASLSKQLLIHSIAFSAPPAVLPYDDAAATLGNIQHQVLRFTIPSRIKENSGKCPLFYRARE